METDTITWNKPEKVVMKKKKAGFKEIHKYVDANVKDLAKDAECAKINEDKSVILQGT